MLASCQSLFFLRESLLSFDIGVLNFQCRAGTFLLAFEEVLISDFSFGVLQEYTKAIGLSKKTL